MENKEQRMRDLVEFFKKKDEIFVDKKTEETTNENLQKEYTRFQNLASSEANSTFKENYLTNTGGKSVKTVNSIIDQMYDNPSVAYKPIRQPLNAEEAFSLAIKRTLKSGAPVNDMGFYDEVNWQLMSLGFPAKSPLDIKNVLIQMIDK